MQKISKYFPYFSIIAQNIPPKYLKTPKICNKKQPIFKTNPQNFVFCQKHINFMSWKTILSSKTENCFKEEFPNMTYVSGFWYKG